jgi:hypothetical protein
MNATKGVLGLLAAAALASAAPPAAAQGSGGAGGTTAAAIDESQDWATWIQQLEDEARKLRELRKTEAALQEEVGRALSRRRPRGEEKARLLAARDRAVADLAAAERQLGALTEQARQAGVPQGMLQDYEELAESPASAGADDSEW